MVKSGINYSRNGGFDREIAGAVFNIPGAYEVGIMIARGYQDSHKKLPEI